MRVIVTGGRTYDDYDALDKALADLGASLIIQGGADGADFLARQWAKKETVPCCTYDAYWAELGSQAGPARNRWMIKTSQPDVVVACPGGRGTAHTKSLAEKAGIPIVEVT